MHSIDQENITNKKVLLRVDYNVSLLPNHHIADDLRIRQSLPTIEYLLKKKNAIILISHLGRPHGVEEKYSLEPVLQRLKAYLPDVKIRFARTIKELQDMTSEKPADVTLLENIRFYEGEDRNSTKFAQELAVLGDVYVNDAFGVSHRACATITKLPTLLPSYAGLLLAHEVNTINKIMNKSPKPFVTIQGGAKISDKIKLLSTLIEKSDFLLLGGGIANTFLKALGVEVGNSFYEASELESAHALLRKAEKEHTKILLPIDAITGSLNGEHATLKDIHALTKHDRILDIGPATQAVFAQAILQAKTIIWNGPVGLHEIPAYAKGTDFIFYAITANTEAMSIVGGGDTLAALKNLEHLDKITHLSTGGGALLSFIENGTLPGIDALK